MRPSNGGSNRAVGKVRPSVSTIRVDETRVRTRRRSKALNAEAQICMAYHCISTVLVVSYVCKRTNRFASYYSEHTRDT